MVNVLMIDLIFTALKAKLQIVSGPCQVKMCLRTCAKCTAAAHPAHVQSIILVFACHSYIL